MKQRGGGNALTFIVNNGILFFFIIVLIGNLFTQFKHIVLIILGIRSITFYLYLPSFIFI